jgi:vacuolar-type H+-ATPase subunit I/STV1
MKKFTIIAAPEYEHLLLEEFSRSSVVQLKEVTGVEFDRLKEGERTADFIALYEKYHQAYQDLIEIGLPDQKTTDLSTVELKRFVDDPEGTVEDFLITLADFKEKLMEAKAEQANTQKEREQRLMDARARLERVRALEPEEMRRSLAVGAVNLNLIERLAEHLQRFDDISYKVIEISKDTGYIFVFGPEEREGWISTLFIIFEVKDVFDVLSTGDILLSLDAGIRERVLNEYEEEVEKLQLLVEREEEEEVIKEQIEKIQTLTSRGEEDLYTPLLGKARFLDYILGIMSNETVPVIRTRLISIIQGWIDGDKVNVLEKIKEDLEAKTGELFFVQYEDPGHDEHAIPTPEPVMATPMLQPAWKLTSLRGWPSAHEINPMYITVLVFSFQFGLMYGDIGQGAVFLLAGLIISRKYKRGMASKIGTLFIPMGLFAILFGIGYDSIFLKEGLLFHHNQFMPNPVEETTTLMKWVFTIAAVEIIFGLVLGAINQWKEGHKWGVLGEHGLGMILYVAGLYLSAMEFIRSGDFLGVLSYWAFYVMMGGMLLAMLEPIIAAIAGGHFSIEVIGEGVGALLMTFVEGLANLFSFLRIVAFALAHASLAGAAHQLAGFMGDAPSLILMNLIAMSFEFMSSGVQSLRLLYYEFMGKFFHGGGVPFRPYRLRIKKS